MFPQEIIRHKRDGATLTDKEIDFFIEGITDWSISECQISALTMAVFLRGMEKNETVALTRAMTSSGSVLDWEAAGLDGPILDKHSTGGVGDKVSLMLAPMLAACGGYVPMISGRGLGHTGGTLDKFDSIPGYDTVPELKQFREVVKSAGCAIIGQTSDLAPADKRIYAVRDVTATVESIPLITASILSKKLAAGLDALIMDLKVGSGAFMENIDDARSLAQSIVSVAKGAGMPTTALITDMNQVLGRTAGNAVEMQEAVDYLTGKHRDKRLHEVTIALCAELLVLKKLAVDKDDAKNKLEASLSSGKAAEIFGKMVAELGGPVDFIENSEKHLPKAPVIIPIYPDRAGFVTAVDTRSIGLAIVTLGGGRTYPEQKLDYSAGFTEIIGVGEEVNTDIPLAIVHAANEADVQNVTNTLKAAIHIGDSKPAVKPVVYEAVTEA